MKLRMAYSTHGPWESGLRTLRLPMEIPLDPYGEYTVKNWTWPAGEVLSTSPDPSRNLLVIVGERAVNSEQMTLKDDPAAMQRDEAGNIRPAKAVASPEIGELTEGAGLVFGAIGFAIGIALPFGMHITPEFSSRYLPDSEADRELLETLGDHPRMPLLAGTGIEVFGDSEIDGDFVREIARRRAVRVYPEALHDISATATFRDLWRTLELAFQAEGRKLTEMLAEFGPAKRLGFDRGELEALRAIRGQISHASSRLGPSDVSRSETAANESLGRLWSLVDWVLLSKKESSQSLEHDELRPLAAFVRRDGSIQIEPWIDDPETWRFGHDRSASPRFRAPDRK